MSAFPESKRIFQRDGKFYEAGEIFMQPDLAKTLSRIAESGSADFYHGETARLLAADMKAHNGTITLADLEAYKAIERKPLTGKYKRLRYCDRAAAQLRRAWAFYKCWACWMARDLKRAARGRRR